MSVGMTVGSIVRPLIYRSPMLQSTNRLARHHLRVNVSKNQGKFKKRGHGQKIDFAHTLSV